MTTPIVYYIGTQITEFWLLLLLAIGAIVGFWLNKEMFSLIRLSLIIPIGFFALILTLAQFEVYSMSVRGLLIKISIAVLLICMDITNFMWLVFKQSDKIEEKPSKFRNTIKTFLRLGR